MPNSLLVLESDDVVRQLIVDSLKKRFPKCIITDAGNDDGLHLEVKRYTVILTSHDLARTSFTGPKLIKKVLASMPDAVIIGMSVYPSREQLFLKVGAKGFFPKSDLSDLHKILTPYLDP